MDNTKNKKPEKKFGSIILRLASYVKPFSGLFFLVLFLNTVFSTLTTVSITTIQPLIKLLFDNNSTTEIIKKAEPGFLENLKTGYLHFIQGLVSVANEPMATLVNLSILIVGIFIVKNIFKYFASVAKVRLDEGIAKSIRDSVYAKMTNLSLDFFTQRKSGTLISIITNDINVINVATISNFTDCLREATQVVLFLILLLSISPYLTFVAFSTSVISLLVLKYGSKYLRRYASRMQSAMADYTSILQETISGIRVVKAYNAEETANDKFRVQTTNYISSAVKFQKIITLIPSINEIFVIVALCVVLYIGGSAVLSENGMKPDELMLFLFSLFAVMSPIATLVNNFSNFQRGFVAAERVFDVLDRQPSVPAGNDDINGFSNSIEIKNVSFAYADIPVIQNADFKIEKTKKIAFVGSSGSGKSTMLDLIIRFYDPVSGEILIDGKNLRSFRLDKYRSLFGIVSQETMLFNDTIANNIRYSFEDASDEEIIKASKIANAYDFIIKLPNGFETITGDRGVLLSGGEKQRIAIARALIRNPYILVFDEATSSLDSESEKIVQDAINSSLKDKTAIIVAHRLATIIDCDEILVFNDGIIAEHGSHLQLLSHNGIYKKLYDIQYNNPIL
ncbi:MAG: ABC transporter ATP-binding protein [Ignavibacteriae bacterium]|nr:ABC transporter ATP-binding protein [Ignavibacteriota bacterium]